jgi:proteasome assembly chaperone (PAC2) family protein
MEDTMLNRILSVSAIALLSITPALAIAPNCETQLAQIQVQLDQQKVKTEALTAKYEQAERLCAAQQEMESQKLAQEIRQEMEQSASTNGGTSGTTTNSNTSQ